MPAGSIDFQSSNKRQVVSLLLTNHQNYQNGKSKHQLLLLIKRGHCCAVQNKHYHLITSNRSLINTRHIIFQSEQKVAPSKISTITCVILKWTTSERCTQGCSGYALALVFTAYRASATRMLTSKCAAPHPASPRTSFYTHRLSVPSGKRARTRRRIETASFRSRQYTTWCTVLSARFTVLYFDYTYVPN